MDESAAIPTPDAPQHLDFLDLGYNQDFLSWIQTIYPEVRILDVAALRDVFVEVRRLFDLPTDRVVSYAFGADYGDRHAKYLKVLNHHGFTTRTFPPAELYVTSHFGGAPEQQSRPLLSPATIMAFAAGQLSERVLQGSAPEDAPSLVVMSGRYEMGFVLRAVQAAGVNVILLGARSMLDGRFFTNKRLEEVFPEDAEPALLDDAADNGRIVFVPLEAFGEKLIGKPLNHLLDSGAVPEVRSTEDNFRF